MAYSVSEKGLCGISKSETLASQCDPGGRNWGVGEGSECGVQHGTGGDLPQDSPSHRVLLQHYNKIKGGGVPLKLKKKREERTVNVCQREGGTKSHPLQISISLR